MSEKKGWISSLNPQAKHLNSLPHYTFKGQELVFAMVVRGAYGMVVDGLGQVGEAAAANEEVNYNVRRSLRYASVGVFLLAPLEYGEWLIVSNLYPSLSLQHAFAKTAIDILIMHPFNSASAMYTNEILRSQDHSVAWAKVRQDFFSLQWRMIVIRPIIDMIAFTSSSSFMVQMAIMSSVHIFIDVWVNISVNRMVENEEDNEGEEEGAEELDTARLPQAPTPRREGVGFPTPGRRPATPNTMRARRPRVPFEEKPEPKKTRYVCCGLFWFPLKKEKKKKATEPNLDDDHQGGPNVTEFDEESKK